MNVIQSRGWAHYFAGDAFVADKASRPSPAAARDGLHNAGMDKRWWWVALTAALVAAGGAALWLHAPVVQAVAVQPQPLLRTLQFSARVASRSRVDVGATVTGRVESVLVRDGDEVRAGQDLLRLEDAEWRAALAQAQAAEAQAAARLSGLRSTGRGSARATVAQAESVWQAARADAQRTRELVSSGFLSPAKQDESERALQVALAQLDVAREQSRAAGDRGTDQAQALAQVNSAHAATQAARVRLAQTRVMAPADAQVLVRDVEPGLIVQPGGALLTLALQGPLQLKALVDERYLQQLQPGQSASVRADAYPDQAFDARVLTIAPLVDAQRGAIEVTLQVDAEPAAARARAGQILREDMTLTVDVVTGRRDRALVVPLSALRSGTGAAGTAGIDGDSSQSQVWVAQDGRVQARSVRTGLRNLQAAEVTEGLVAGAQVLVGAAPPPGSRVRVEVLAAPTGNLRDVGLAGRPGGDAGSALSNAMGR